MKENYLFRLHNIKTVQFATIGAPPEEGEIEITAGIDFAIESKVFLIACISRFEFLSEGNIFIILSVTCEFEVEADTWKGQVKTDEQKHSFDASLMQHLGVVTVGTARGVLHTKTEDTAFNKFFLPTVNVTQIVPENVKFPLEEQ